MISVLPDRRACHRRGAFHFFWPPSPRCAKSRTTYYFVVRSQLGDKRNPS